MQSIFLIQHFRMDAHKQKETVRPRAEHTYDEFCMDLCRAYIEAEIPLSKLQYPASRKFYEKYTGFSVPCESDIREIYLPRLAQAGTLSRSKHEVLLLEPESLF